MNNNERESGEAKEGGVPKGKDVNPSSCCSQKSMSRVQRPSTGKRVVESGDLDELDKWSRS